jgi:hypothetical protein
MRGIRHNRTSLPNKLANGKWQIFRAKQRAETGLHASRCVNYNSSSVRNNNSSAVRLPLRNERNEWLLSKHRASV